MMMRTRERLLLATLLMAASSSTSAATRPNIIFIVADDLGWTIRTVNYPGSKQLS